ncbi:hypothetical protein [Gallaecimonas sp. GXIMD4217]|uniref:hypothetical protein n=1 Tax=Gallaecimonas sp. GXIMD4217 TaxID=3131927 RepID=UPI00311AE1FF
MARSGRPQLGKRLLLYILLLFPLPVLLQALAGYQLLDGHLDKELEAELARTERQVSERFAIFDALMDGMEAELNARFARDLPALTDALLAEPQPLHEIPPKRLTELAERFGFHHVYVIRRDTQVVNTNFAPDLHFRLADVSDALADHLEGIYGSGRVFTDRIGISDQTGIIKKYAYFSPPGADYIIEIDLDFKVYLSQRYGADLADFLFRDLFEKLLDGEAILQDLGLHLILDDKVFRFAGNDFILPQSLLARLQEGASVRQHQGDRLFHYQPIALTRTRFQNSDYMVLSSSYDLDGLVQIRRNLLLSTAFVLIVSLLLGLKVARHLSRHHLGAPLTDMGKALKGYLSGRSWRPLEQGSSQEANELAQDLNALIALCEERLARGQVQLEEAAEECHRRNQALRQLEKRLQLFHQVAGEGFFDFRFDQPLYYQSQQHRALLHFAPDAHVSLLDWLRRLPTATRRQFMAALHRLKHESGPQQLTYQCQDDQGARFWLHSTLAAQVEGGRLVRLYGCSRPADGEVEMQEHYQLLQCAFDGREGIAVFDDQGLLRQHNPAFARALVMGDIQLMQSDASSLAEQCRLDLAPLQARLEKQGQCSWEGGLRRADGQPFPCQLRIRRLELAQGSGHRYVVHLWDMSLREQRQPRQSESA